LTADLVGDGGRSRGSVADNGAGVKEEGWYTIELAKCQVRVEPVAEEDIVSVAGE